MNHAYKVKREVLKPLCICKPDEKMTPLEINFFHTSATSSQLTKTAPPEPITSQEFPAFLSFLRWYAPLPSVTIHYKLT